VSVFYFYVPFSYLSSFLFILYIKSFSFSVNLFPFLFLSLFPSLLLSLFLLHSSISFPLSISLHLRWTRIFLFQVFLFISYINSLLRFISPYISLFLFFYVKKCIWLDVPVSFHSLFCSFCISIRLLRFFCLPGRPPNTTLIHPTNNNDKNEKSFS